MFSATKGLIEHNQVGRNLFRHVGLKPDLQKCKRQPQKHKPQKHKPQKRKNPAQGWVLIFFRKLNAWRTVASYVLYVDQPSYAQLHAHHG